MERQRDTSTTYATRVNTLVWYIEVVVQKLIYEYVEEEEMVMVVGGESQEEKWEKESKSMRLTED